MNKINVKRGYVIPVFAMIAKWGLMASVFYLGKTYLKFTSLKAFAYSLTVLPFHLILIFLGLLLIRLIMYLWEYGIHKDINTMACFVEGTKERNFNFGLYVGLSLITCDLYTLYYCLKQGKRLEKTSDFFEGLTVTKGSTYILLWGLGMLLLMTSQSFVWILLTSNVNRIGPFYNRYLYMDDEENAREEAHEESFDYHYDPSTGEAIEDDNQGETLRYTHQLLFNSGEYAGCVIDLANRETIVLGRDGNEVNLVFQSRKISKKHVSITFSNRAGGFIVHDYSSNGTYFQNGMRLPKNEDVVCPASTMINLALTDNIITLL